MPEYPPQLTSIQPGTWAHSTVSVRLPKIARRVLDEKKFPPAVQMRIRELIEDIPESPIRHLLDIKAPDGSDWKYYTQPWLGKGWLEVPWFFAEHYFYRRLMEAVDYFRVGQDPFSGQKKAGLDHSREIIRQLAEFSASAVGGTQTLKDSLGQALYLSLWGNQADLSLWPAGSDDDPLHSSQAGLQDHLLANQLDDVLAQLLRQGLSLQRVDLLLDNAGLELVADLVLAELLITRQVAGKVLLHSKFHPTFVSDVTDADLLDTIRWLETEASRPVQELGQRLRALLEGGTLIYRSDRYWNSPLALWEMPDRLREVLRDSGLLISKGDANYRRILGDRAWEFTRPFQDVVGDFPVPLAALRTLKSELGSGMDEKKIEAAAGSDPEWLVNGRWGVIQYAP